MKRSPLSTAVFGLVMIGFSLAVQPVLAQQSDTLDRDLARLQAHMREMRADLAGIEAETDPAKRRRLLQDHMQGMHEAMSLMRQEMMPAMKRRMHTHTHAPGASRQDADADEWSSEAHMEKMDAMMAQMAELMEQMSAHRRMLDSDDRP